jgi:serine/threonine protein kinase
LFSRKLQSLWLIDFEGSCAAVEGAFYNRFGNNLYRAPELSAAKPPSSRRGAPLPPAFLFDPLDGSLTPGAPVGCKADIWSAGVVLAELMLRVRRLLSVDDLAGSYARLEKALNEHAQARIVGEADPRAVFCGYGSGEAGIGRAGADLLVRLLDFSPQERPTAAEALCHPFFAEAGDDGDGLGE